MTFGTWKVANVAILPLRPVDTAFEVRSKAEGCDILSFRVSLEDTCKLLNAIEWFRRAAHTFYRTSTVNISYT